MKTTISRSQWMAIGKKAGWAGWLGGKRPEGRTAPEKTEAAPVDIPQHEIDAIMGMPGADDRYKPRRFNGVLSICTIDYDILDRAVCPNYIQKLGDGSYVKIDHLGYVRMKYEDLGTAINSLEQARPEPLTPVLADRSVKITLSKSQWTDIGKTAGWMDVIRKVKDALGPDPTNPYFDKSEQMRDDNGAYHLGTVLEEEKIIKTPGADINLQQLEEAVNQFPSSDPELVLALPRAIGLIKDPKTQPKTASGMRVVLYRLFRLRPNHPVRKQSEEIIRKWYQQKKQSDALWEKPRNPYINQLKSRSQKDGWMKNAVANDGGEENTRVNFSFGTTPENVIRDRTLSQTPAGYPMHIKSQAEWAVIAKAVNQGIDSHLEGFTHSIFDHKTGKCLIHPEEMTTFLRRLAEIGDEKADGLRIAILETLGVEEI